MMVIQLRVENSSRGRALCLLGGVEVCQGAIEGVKWKEKRQGLDERRTKKYKAKLRRVAYIKAASWRIDLKYIVSCISFSSDPLVVLRLSFLRQRFAIVEVPAVVAA